MEFYKILNNYTGSRLWHGYPPPSVDESVPTVLGPLFVKKNPVWKRGLDLFGSLCGLIVLSPLFLIIGILIKSVSPGPILFKQKRVGSGGRIFNCLKFRTMTLNADSTVHKEYLEKLIGSCHASEHRGVPMEKLPEDTRIIRFGHFLRASGLDELPQLINVLYGQMSLVGPRPPIPYEVQQYRHWYNGRFDVVPGLTGLWQVSGKNKLGFNEMIRLDIQYAMKRSFLLDCKILLMTPYAIFRQIREMRPTRNTMPGERSLDRR